MNAHSQKRIYYEINSCLCLLYAGFGYYSFQKQAENSLQPTTRPTNPPGALPWLISG
jgi:hypothetical protein